MYYGTEKTLITLIKQSSVCALLDVSRSGLDKLKRRDPLFPKPIKNGSSRQAAVYYSRAEVENYIASRLAARGASSSTLPVQDIGHE